MLKKPLTITLSVVLTSLISTTSVLANNHENMNKAKDAKNAPHPAHEMGQDVKTKKDEKLSEEYKENMNKAKDAKNAPHPAHKMGESEELKERGQ